MITPSLKEILQMPAKTPIAQVKGKVCAVNEYTTGENASGPYSLQEIMLTDDSCTLLLRIGYKPEIKKEMIGKMVSFLSAKKPTGQLVGVKVDEMDVEEEGETKRIKYLSISRSAEYTPLVDLEAAPEEDEPAPEKKPEPVKKVEQKKQVETVEHGKIQPVQDAAKITPLNISEVRFDRTVNTGNYCNQRIGITVDIAKGEDPNAAMEAAKAWVEKHAPKEIRG